MSTYVLDYSSGYPSPEAIKNSGYVGIVRYIGTPGHAKNLSLPEWQAMREAGIPTSLVYESTAGWMLDGSGAGTAAAQAALANARNLGVPVRCVYFACDQQVLTQAQMFNVAACLDAAAQVLGRTRTGVYGQYSVIEAMVDTHAAYGWQTRAWSAGSISNKAHIYQEVGYVYPGGVECDRSRVLKDDWGQVPYRAADPADRKEREVNMFYMEAPGRSGVIVNVPSLTGVDGPTRDAFRAAVANGAVGAPVPVAQYDLVFNWARTNGVVNDIQEWATGRHDEDAATLRELLQQWPAVRDAVKTITTGGVDLDALATKVADEIYRRMQS